MVDPTLKQSDPPPPENAETPPSRDRSGSVNTTSMLWHLVLAVGFLWGSWAMVSYNYTNGCELDGLVFVCEDGSKGSPAGTVLWPGVAAFGGLAVLALAITEFVSLAKTPKSAPPPPPG